MNNSKPPVMLACRNVSRCRLWMSRVDANICSNLLKYGWILSETCSVSIPIVRIRLTCRTSPLWACEIWASVVHQENWQGTMPQNPNNTDTTVRPHVCIVVYCWCKACNTLKTLSKDWPWYPQGPDCRKCWFRSLSQNLSDERCYQTSKCFRLAGPCRYRGAPLWYTTRFSLSWSITSSKCVLNGPLDFSNCSITTCNCDFVSLESFSELFRNLLLKHSSPALNVCVLAVMQWHLRSSQCKFCSPSENATGADHPADHLGLSVRSACPLVHVLKFAFHWWNALVSSSVLWSHPMWKCRPVGPYGQYPLSCFQLTKWRPTPKLTWSGVVLKLSKMTPSSQFSGGALQLLWSITVSVSAMRKAALDWWHASYVRKALWPVVSPPSGSSSPHHQALGGHTTSPCCPPSLAGSPDNENRSGVRWVQTTPQL